MLRARLVAAFPAWKHEGRVDQQISLHIGPPNSGKTHDAKLRTLLSEIDSSTRTVTAIFELGAAPNTTRVGQLGRLKMIGQTKARGFWLPITALAEGRRGLWSAYALEPVGPDTAVREVSLRELQLLNSEEDRAFVRGTLRDGEMVVASGLHRLVPGQQVRIAVSDVNEPTPNTSSDPTR